jgi:Uma2 family endonuclease
VTYALLKPLDENDYLAGEIKARLRHEFIDGEVYAMAGGSANHNRVAVNLTTFCNLRAHSGCNTFASDMKLRLAAGNIYYYPDVMLVRDEQDTGGYFKTSPCMVAEVLSPSTELTDRREKWGAYQHLPSLKEYVLLSQDRPHVEVYSRVEARDGLAGAAPKAVQWARTVLGEGDSLTLACGGLTVTLAELYRGVDFSNPEPYFP